MPPMFQSYPEALSVLASISVGAVIGLVRAWDPDKTPSLRFSISSGVQDGAIQVNTTSGRGLLQITLI